MPTSRSLPRLGRRAALATGAAAADQNLDGGPPSQLVCTTRVGWGRWKAVRHAPGSDPLIADGKAIFELYDLSSDPAEHRNVASLNPEVVERLQQRMRASHAPPPYRRLAYRPQRTGGEFLTQA